MEVSQKDPQIDDPISVDVIMAQMRFRCLQHADCEGPGAIADWLVAHGHTLETSRIHSGEQLPLPDAFDALVVMGGPMNVYQYRDYPWLQPERVLIQQAIAAGKPVIGICLGAQLIADSLGARVTQNPEIEIGWFPVRFTPEARFRFESLPDEATVFHWHGDTFELPANAVRLAGSDACAQQGFSYRDNVLALQFHPEASQDMIAALLAESGGVPRGKHQQAPAALLRGAGSFAPAAHRLLDDLLEIFLS